MTCLGKLLIVLVMKYTHFSVSIKQYSGLFLNCRFLDICSLCCFPSDLSTSLYKLSHCIKVPLLFFLLIFIVIHNEFLKILNATC
jgi:hypothetical protein